MRLLSIELSGFRGFAAKQTFDLSGDAVIVVGANGNGKTSLFDAILWGIAGRVPRLGTDDNVLTSRFSETGQARVVLRMASANGSSPFTVTRLFDGKQTKVSVETAEGISRGPEAEGQLIREIWREAASAASPQDAIATALTRSVYLQQDLVCDFFDSVTANERFSAISELVGAGRVTDLQAELERAKRAWSAATNTRSSELQPLRARLAAMEARLADLARRVVSADTRFDDAAWSEWWTKLSTLGITVQQPATISSEAATSVELAVRQADAARLATERQKQMLDTLREDCRSLAGDPVPAIEPVRAKLALAQQRLQETRSKIAAEQGRVAEFRRAQAQLKEKSQQLRALAALALQNLAETCPVCDQTYDVEATRRRLASLAAGEMHAETTTAPHDQLQDLFNILATEEKQHAEIELEVRAAESRIRDRANRQEMIDRRLHDVGIQSPMLSDAIARLTAELESADKRTDALATAQKLGEVFSLTLSVTSDLTTRRELEREIAATRARLQNEDADLARRALTGERAQRIIEALREASSRVVSKRISEIEPLLSDIYGRIDVHPAFRVVRFLTSIVRGKGQLATVVSDPLYDVESDSPSTVLSSSQMNALAVCTFLSLNLGVADPPLQSAILDDPLQSLDDINLLGLIELLRRMKDQRQLIISTHDLRFGNLLAQKLRPASQEQRTVMIELEGWSRTGPAVSTRNVPSDPVPLRLAG